MKYDILLKRFSAAVGLLDIVKKKLELYLVWEPTSITPSAWTKIRQYVFVGTEWLSKLKREKSLTSAKI